VKDRFLLTLLLPLASVLLATGAPAQPAAERSPFELSGVQRSRYETIDEQFGGGLSGSDHVLALQTSLFLDWRHDSLQLYGEIMDSRGVLNDERSSVGTFLVNSLEPIQAYAAWTFGDPGNESTLRAGRLTLDIGKRRIVSRNRYRNTVTTFTGVDWQWRGTAGRNARAIYLLPMRILPAGLDDLLDNEFELDRGQRGTAIWGGFYQLPKGEHGDTVELYAFKYDSDGTAADPSTFFDIWTYGTRVFRAAAKGKWNYEVEGVLQTGDSGGTVAGVQRRDLGHDAHMLHFEVGFQFDTSWAPNLVFQYDDASGDKSPLDGNNERFNSLFGDRRFEFVPTGIYGPFSRSNLDSRALRLTMTPSPRWQGMVHYSDFRLAAERDTWIGVGTRDTSGAADGALGRQIEGSVTWTAIPDRLTLEGGVAHLAFGRFAQQTGVASNGDPTYFYAVATTRF
jgi:hypothetical protein